MAEQDPLLGNRVRSNGKQQWLQVRGCSHCSVTVLTLNSLQLEMIPQ